ncbi:CBS and ACT domain-containing protein [bacterium]|nr:CBS and ACT domain-containing protein [bacterium]
MLVLNWMSRNVITIDVDDSLHTAIKLLKKYKIRSLPVMKDRKLVGIVSNGDIKRASASDATSLDIHEILYLIDKIKISDIMTKKPVTVLSSLTVDEVAEILLEKNISSAPVIDENNDVIGIITRSDILKVLIHLTGVERRGVDFGLKVKDEPGSIKGLTDIIRAHNGRIASILISYEQVVVGYRNVFIRVYQTDRKTLDHLKSELFRNSHMLYIIDHLEQKREIFN